MAITKIKDGGDFFDAEHSGAHRAFGFGGSVGGNSPHPMGHGQVARVEKRFDGSVVEHHAHGGKTVHHLGGMVTHHKPSGAMMPATPPSAGADAPGMAPDLDDDGMKDGGSVHNAPKQFAAGGTVRNAPKQFKDGGSVANAQGKQFQVGGKVRLPRGMKPPEMHTHSPINSAPRNPRITDAPTGSMPGGVMPYGLQPSREPGYKPIDATTDGPPDDINGMKKGGRVGRADGGPVGGGEHHGMLITMHPIRIGKSEGGALGDHKTLPKEAAQFKPKGANDEAGVYGREAGMKGRAKR